MAADGDPKYTPLTADDLPLIAEYWKGWERLSDDEGPVFIKAVNVLLLKGKWNIADIRRVKELASIRFATDYAFLVKNNHPLYRRYVGEAIAVPRCSVADFSRFAQENPDVDLASLPADSPYADPRFRRRAVAPPACGCHGKHGHAHAKV